MDEDPSEPEAGRERLRAVLGRLDGIVDWERRDRSAGMVRTLAAVEDLLARLGDPQTRFRAVHVAGSKGKGSVSALVAAALTGAGLRAGCYASPHVERTTERVRVDGREVSTAALAEALETAWEARAAAEHAGSPAGAATWFDVMTAAAFWRFAADGCAWAVVECGLGGRLDSTRPVRGEVAVVTSVELEHTAVLGSTRTAIAGEKGAILEPGRALVTGARAVAGDDPLPVLAELARERGGRLVVVDPAGDFDARNQRLARAVLAELGRLEVRGADGALIGPERLDAAAVTAARLPARSEVFEARGRRVLLDGAHVAASVTELLRGLPPEAGDSLPAVLALGRDKDASAVLKALRTRADRVHCTSLADGPLIPADELARLAREAGFASSSHARPVEALWAAVEEAPLEGWVVALGSFYLAGAIRPLLAVGVHRAPPGEPC